MINFENLIDIFMLKFLTNKADIELLNKQNKSYADYLFL
jgi:hypothetical protein